MNPKQFAEQELKKITEAFNEQGMIDTAVYFFKDDNRFAIPVTFNNEAQKVAVEQGVKDMVKRAMPDTVIYVSEAWAAWLNDDPRMPTDRPDRIEVVVVQIEFKTGEKYGCAADIIRNGGNIHLGEFKIVEGEQAQGLFTDFYPPSSVN